MNCCVLCREIWYFSDFLSLLIYCVYTYVRNHHQTNKLHQRSEYDRGAWEREKNSRRAYINYAHMQLWNVVIYEISGYWDSKNAIKYSNISQIIKSDMASDYPFLPIDAYSFFFLSSSSYPTIPYIHLYRIFSLFH